MKKTRMMPLTITALSLTAGLLAGCSNPSLSGSEGAASPSSTAGKSISVDQAAAAALPQAIRDKGTLTVTMSQSSPPLHFMAGDGTTTLGVDADLAQAIGTTLGLKTTIASGPFDGIIPGLQAGKYDLAISQMSPSASRLQVLDFVDYFQSGSGIGVQAGNPEKLTGDTLCGKKVGVLKGSFQDTKRLPQLSKACTDGGKEAIVAMTYPDMQAPELALTSGRIDAVYVDGPTLGYAIKQGAKIDLLTEKNLSAVSIGFKKGAGFEKALQLALKSLADNGKYKEILDKWGVSTGAITDFAFDKAQ